jgi:formamidopyrimidine-DNA glycosylase
MPELPEAETLARGLRPLLPGRTIRHVRVHHADVLRTSPARFRAAVRGRTIEAVDRRAKNVLLRLDDGGVLLVNLGMTGWLATRGLAPRDPPRPTHPALTFQLDPGGALVFDDVRRFGCVERLDAAGWRARESRFGPEPLDDGFGAADLRRALSSSRTPVRSWLLDQRRLAGVGNIYANEALHRARVHPARPARSLGRAESRALHRAIRDVLTEALRAGGTTIQDYRNAEGEPGEFVRELRVYGRTGEPCPRCKTPVERLVFANRSAFLCPTCQPEGPSAPRGE